VAVELGDVVAHEEQSPLGPDCLSAAVIEPLELPVVFGVTEHRLDRLLPFGISGKQGDRGCRLLRRGGIGTRSPPDPDARSPGLRKHGQAES